MCASVSGCGRQKKREGVIESSGELDSARKRARESARERARARARERMVKEDVLTVNNVREIGLHTVPTDSELLANAHR